jgi:uncharacterized protein DUF6476
MPNHSAETDEKPLDPEQQKIVARVRWLMLLSGLATMLGIVVVIGVIGYRILRADVVGIATDAAVTLPKGAKVLSTAMSGDRIAVVVDLGGVIEVRTFDLKSLRPAGRLRISTEP